jgi:hypothetical protein
MGKKIPVDQSGAHSSDTLSTCIECNILFRNRDHTIVVVKGNADEEGGKFLAGILRIAVLMVLLFRTAVSVPLKVSLRVCVEAIMGFYSCKRMRVRLLAGNSALWSVFFMEFHSECFQAFCFSAAVFHL